MKTPTLHPVALRVLLITLVVLLLAVSLGTFYQFAGTATDENLFISPPTNYFVTRPIPAYREPPAARAAVPDTVIPAGTYLSRFKSSSSLVEDLAPLKPDSVVYVRAYAPLARASSRLYYARVGDLRDSLNFRIFPDHVVVVDVTPGGASDRAGMHVLDRILAINGQTFANAEEADRLMRQGQSGKALDYDVLRDDTRIRLHVTMASFGFPLPVLVMSLTGLLIFASGAFILLKRPHLIAARLVGLNLVITGFFISMILVAQEPGPSLISVAGSVLFTSAFALIFPVGRHAAAYFPREVPGILSRPWSIRLLYVLAAAMIALGIGLNAVPMQKALRFILYFFAASIVLGGTSAVLYILARKDRTPEYLRMNRPLRIAMWSALAGSIALSVAIALNRWERLYGFVGIPLLAIPAAHFYIIGRYRLLEMQLRVRRNVQWGFLTALWAGITLVILFTILVYLVVNDFGLPQVTIRGLSVEVDPGHPGAAATDVTARGFSVLLGIGMFVVIRAVRKTGQSYIDRTFYREPTDYTHAVGAFSEVLSKRLPMVELGRGMVQKLAEILRLKQAAVLFFREDGECCCHEVLGLPEDVWKRTCDIADPTLASHLAKLPGESRVEYLPPALKDRCQRAGFRFVIPIRSKDRLIGVLLLGEKRSETAYTSGDLEFLSAAAHQSSVAIENAFLYEELTEKERMETELHIARRIQLASLPQRTPALKPFEVAGISLPALEVGGDFYDYLADDGRRLTVIVGDVSGKGTSAALYMSKVQGILRSLHEFQLSPGAMFVRANRLLAADMAKNSFVTAIGATFAARTRSVVVARAGHLPLYVFRAATRSVEALTPRGLGLALDENRTFVRQLRELRTRFAPGDVFLFVSDGVVEAHNPEGEEYGETRLRSLLVREAHQPAAEIRDAILADLEVFLAGREREDDCTVVVVRILPRGRIA